MNTQYGVSGDDIFADFFENSTIGFHNVAADGTIIKANGFELQMLGYSKEEYVGRNIAQFHVDQSVCEDILRRLQSHETLSEYSAQLRKKDGSIKHVIIDSSVRWDDGKFLYTRCITRDVTRLKQAEEDVRRLNADLERAVDDVTRELKSSMQDYEAFAYTVAHDLRAPIRSIHGYGQITLKRFQGELPEEAARLISQMITSSKRMDLLVTDLLAYSRLGRENFTIEPVELEAVISETLESMSEVRESDASIDVQKPLPGALAHSGILAQALTNLVSNAVKFSSPGVKPRVVIRGEERGDRIRLWVEDNGIGVPAEYQERIFSVFQRLHSLGTYPGTGIGLAIVRRAAERMGGSAGVESTEGQGSRFWIELGGVQ